MNSAFVGAKRGRTEGHSPHHVYHHLFKSKAKREQEQISRKKMLREKERHARDEAFLKTLYMSCPIPEPRFSDISSGSSASHRVNQDDTSSEELACRLQIEESRRKICELEKDKPLWERAANERKKREDLEQQLRDAEKRDRRRKRSAGLGPQLQEEWEARQNPKCDPAIGRETKKKRARFRETWERGPWTNRRALARYQQLCKEFDQAKFSPGDPLTFEDVPWPMLERVFSVKNIDWNTVEEFFSACKTSLDSKQYRDLVDKSLQR